MNAGTVDKLKVAMERGLPVILSSYSMSGATTPITPAGTLTVLLAELLAGLTIFYDPQSMLINLACAEM